MAAAMKISALRARLGRTFPEVEAVFDDLAAAACRRLSPKGVEAWLEGGRFLGSLGRGAEPMLAFFEKAPEVAALLGEDAIDLLKDFAYTISRTPNANAIVPFLQVAPTAARRLEDIEQFQAFLAIVKQVMDATTTSTHGIVATHPSPCLVDFLGSVPTLLGLLSLSGLKSWVEFGIRSYTGDPQGQSDYFALQSVEAHNVLQRERHGTLLVDHERALTLYLQGLWRQSARFRPYSLLFHELRKPQPYLDKDDVMHLPDVYDDVDSDRGRIKGIDRYRAAIAHMAAHRRWTTPIVADNLSPFQKAAASVFEDVRVELLACRRWPGLRTLWLGLHPKPVEGAAPADQCDVFHRLAMLSRASLDPSHGYRDPLTIAYAEKLRQLAAAGGDTQQAASLAVEWYVQSKKPSDLSTTMFLEDVEVGYRDDNRHMWLHVEADDADAPDASTESEAKPEEIRLPPVPYDEWDDKSKRYRPDWVSLYEHLHPSASSALVDQLLARHAPLARRLEKLIDILKPQERVRIRFQEEGSELDLDVAIRSLIDFRAGSQPDPRINMSHRASGRSIAVTLLLDLSVSLNEKPPGLGQTILELSQEAVSLLAWAVDKMGDPLAIGGFHSNSRHEVRYYHLKGFAEPWGDTVKARIAAMEGAYSTRMGAAMRHAGRGLARQQAEKRLLLVLTDGRPHDVDVKDEQYLIRDAHMAVKELDREGIYTYCINLDPKADEYVADIFGRRYSVIDHVDRLPEKLPELFISLTK